MKQHNGYLWSKQRIHYILLVIHNQTCLSTNNCHTFRPSMQICQSKWTWCNLIMGTVQVATYMSISTKTWNRVIHNSITFPFQVFRFTCALRNHVNLWKLLKGAWTFSSNLDQSCYLLGLFSIYSSLTWIVCALQNYYIEENFHVCRQELGTSNYSMQSLCTPT